MKLPRPFARRRRAAGVEPGGALPHSAEVDELLRLARQSFVRLQAAWDAADIAALASLTSGPLLDELRDQLAARPPGPNRTEVLTLDARLLGIDELEQAFVASVEFSGLIRERTGDGAAPFRELWMLARPKAGPGHWQIAQVQALA